MLLVITIFLIKAPKCSNYTLAHPKTAKKEFCNVFPTEDQPLGRIKQATLSSCPHAS